MNICVFGAARDDIAPAYFALGEALGRALARGGHTMVFGGGAHGLMGAAARGAASLHGRIVSVAPRFFQQPGILFEDCAEHIRMDTMAERKSIMRERSDAFLALPGGIGTMEEVLEVITLRSLGQLSKPVALLECQDYWAPLVGMLEAAADKGFASRSLLSAFGRFTEPEEALAWLETEASHDL